MHITKFAADKIHQLMKDNGLDSKQFYLQIDFENQKLKVSFTNEPIGKKSHLHGLSICTTHGVHPDLAMDFGEIDGGIGFIFLQKKYLKRNVT